MRLVRSSILISGAVVALATGCQVDRGTALFEVPRAGQPASEFYALPFPNDIRRDDAGHPMMADYPHVQTLVNLYLDYLERLDGFGTNNAIFTRYSTTLRHADLPADAAASLRDDASVYLVDVDPDSPYRGDRIPLRFRFQDYAGWTIGENWLSALPEPGFPMHEHTTYALVVTDRIDSSQLELQPDADFAAIAGTAPLDDPALQRAHDRYQPLWDWLDEPGGDERGDVLSAAVFTTQSISGIMGDIRTRVRTLPEPLPQDVTQVMQTDQPTVVQYDGTYDGPNFQTGTVPYLTPDDGGDIVYGDDGLPSVQRTENIRFSFTIPANKPMPDTGWPVVIYAHGTGGDYHSYYGDGTGKRMAAEGMATISIDQVLHGPRNPGGDPDVNFFNFYNPLAARNNAIQGAADDFTVVRLIDGYGDHNQDGIKFDPSKIYFFGHSQGGLTGPPFIAYEPEVKGAVLSGAGGLLYYALLNKTEPFDVTNLVHTVIIDNPLDEFNPVLALLQMWIERSDTVNYGPLLVREPPPGEVPRPIYQSMGFVDHYTPDPDIAALAVAIGGDHVKPVIQPIPGLALRGHGEVDAPVSNNENGVTSVLVQYQASASSDGHFVVFDVALARHHSAEFLGTLSRSGTATLVSP